MNIKPFIEGMQAGTIKFRSMPKKVKAEVVGFLKCQGMLAQEIGALIDCPPSTVYWWWKHYCASMAEMIRRSAWTFLGRIACKGEHLYKAAVREQDYALAWKIETDLFDRLQKMGLIDEKAQVLDVNVTARSAEVIEKELDADLILIERLKARAAGHALPAPGPGGNGHAGNGNGSNGNGAGHPPPAE